MYEYVFVDMDGTITESKPGIFNAIEYACNKLGLQLPDNATLNKFIGPPLVYSFSTYMGLTDEEANIATKTYREYYVDKGAFESLIYDGVEDMLKALKVAGKHLVVCTAKPEPQAKTILAHFGMDKYFDHICGASLDRSRNNKSLVFGYAMETCGITDTSKIVMVGDRADDVNGAHGYGVDCIGVLYGYGDAQELHEAEYIAPFPKDVVEIILNASKAQ